MQNAREFQYFGVRYKMGVSNFQLNTHHKRLSKNLEKSPCLTKDTNKEVIGIKFKVF